MEFFIPGLLLFLLFLFIAFNFIPRATPMIAAILSIIFLIYGVRQHSQLFASEYRLSTWQEGLKMYAPAIMIIVCILFVIYSMLAFFTGGSVPVPPMPAVELPTANSLNNIATNFTNSINTAKDSISNGLQLNGTNKGNNNTLLGSLMNNNTNNNNRGNNNKKNNNGIRKSILETI